MKAKPTHVEKPSQAETGRKKAPTPSPPSGETTPVLEGDMAPRLPHERDESVSHEEGPEHEVIHQAAQDIKDGLQDTDKGPVLKDLHERISKEKTPKK